MPAKLCTFQAGQTGKPKTGLRGQELLSLREDVERFRLLVENSHDLVVEVALDGRLLYISPNVQAVLGHEPHDLLHTIVFEHVHPDDLPHVQEQFALPEGRATCRFRHKDGSWRWLETTGRDFLTLDGQQRGVLIARDVTERTLAESDLRENQRVLATLLSNLPGMAYRSRNDADWTMEFVSEGCRELTGYTREDFLGDRRTSFRQLIVPEYRESVWNQVQNSLQARKSHELTYCIRTSDGTEKWVWERGQGVFSGEGRLLAVEGFITDITSQRRNEQARRESEEKFSKAFHSCPGAMGIADGVTRQFIDVNDGYSKLFGFGREEIIGRSSAELKLWDSQEEHQRFLEALANHGSVREMEIVGRTKSDERISCLISAEFIELAGRKCVVSSLQDITGRRQAEKEKAQLEVQLHQAQELDALGTLAGGIAHDFNNILAIILAYAELADMDLEKPVEVRKCLAEIHRAGERARDLVRQILTFSRQQKQERKPTRLQLIVTDALKFLRSTLPATLEIDSQIDPETPVALADPSQIHRVIMNLCMNAAHAMREHPGRLTVSLRSCDVSEVQAQALHGARPGRYVRLTVSDTGHGMDPAILQRIFEPFFTTKPPDEGTGLGLSVVQGIVKEHDGAIAVQSQPEIGTTFDLYFPVHQTGQVEAAEIPACVPRGRHERILFVDDEVGICASARACLERLGYQVTTQTSSQEALEHFSVNPEAYELVIVDLTMPKMTGVDFARQVLTLSPRKPVLLSSGFSGGWTRETLRELGICDLIPKPATVSDLGHAVSRALALNTVS